MLKRLFVKRKQEVKGEIGFLKIEDWWSNTLTEDERGFLLDNVKYLGSDKSARYHLIEADIVSSSLTVLKFANSMLTYVKSNEELELAKKLVDIAIKNTVVDDENAFDMHLLLGNMGDVYYKNKNKDNNLSNAIEFYKKQIAISTAAASAWKKECKIIGGTPGRMPSHRGYTQMAIILEKQKYYREAYKLCKKANNEEWTGDWDKRIERLHRKLENMTNI